MQTLHTARRTPHNAHRTAHDDRQTPIATCHLSDLGDLNIHLHLYAASEL